MDRDYARLVKKRASRSKGAVVVAPPMEQEELCELMRFCDGYVNSSVRSGVGWGGGGWGWRWGWGGAEWSGVGWGGVGWGDWGAGGGGGNHVCPLPPSRER